MPVDVVAVNELELTISPVTLDHPDYPDVCAFAGQQYERKLACSLKDYYPVYLAATDSEGIKAVVGIRVAAQGDLFLERYLDAPIEVTLGDDLQRSDIVELGCFAAIDKQSALPLMMATARYLYANKTRYVVCTANRAIRTCLACLKIPVQEIGTVDARKVPGGADAWGRYYESDPRILAGSVEAGLAAMGDRLGLAA